MLCRSTLAFLALLSVPAAATAQHGGGATPPSTTAPREATQYDFLVGQWELVVRPKVASLAARIHGAPRMLGVWKAWRAFDGWGVEDELRIVDGSGNPTSLTHGLRVFDAAARKWTQTLLDVYRARFTTATAEWRDSQMWVTGQGTDQEGRPTISRSRFYDITPNGFKYQTDRSSDGGRTWDEAVLRIEATRVAAAAPR